MSAITLTGSNTYQVLSQLNSLKDNFIRENSDLALEVIDAEEKSYEQIMSSVEAVPFLTSKKMIILKNFSGNQGAKDNVEILCSKADQTTEIIFVETQLDKRSSLNKKLQKLTDFHEFKDLPQSQLIDWIVDLAKNMQAKISHKDADYLISRVGVNQFKISYEIEKLANYNSKIDQQTINLLTQEQPTSTVFNLLDSMMQGNTKKALKIYEEQRKLKVEPQAVHAMLVWQMHVVAVIGHAPPGTSPKQIAADSGLNPFVVSKSLSLAKKFNSKKQAQITKLLRDIDYKSKHQTFDYDEAIKLAILSQ